MHPSIHPSVYLPIPVCRSAEWDDVSESEVPRAVIDDGEFWISLQDFMTYFSQTTICSLTPDFDMDGSSDALSTAVLCCLLLSFSPHPPHPCICRLGGPRNPVAGFCPSVSVVVSCGNYGCVAGIPSSSSSSSLQCPASAL